MNEQTLKPCPFCGGEAVIKSKRVLYGFNFLSNQIDYVTVSARCKKCHSRGGVAGGKIVYRSLESKLPLPAWATTMEELFARAIDAWNRRIYNAEIH